MSRKTRKLMWSVPLIAAVAVIGALAAFMTLGTGDLFADELSDAPIKLDVEAADGNSGRTTLILTWEAPASGAPDMYRIDRSKDNNKWTYLTSVAGTTLTYTDDKVPGKFEDGTTRYYRVLAMDGEHGAGAVSTSESDTTDPITVPAQVKPFDTAPDGPEAINLTWTAPDDGGSDILGYCIRAWPTGTSEDPIEAISPENCTTAFFTNGPGGSAGNYRADGNTGVNDEDGGIIRILPGTSYTHKGRRAMQEWSYEIYALNEHGYSQTASAVRDAIADEANDPPKPGNLLVRQVDDDDNEIIELYWTVSGDGGQDIIAYRVEVSDTSEAWAFEDTALPTILDGARMSTANLANKVTGDDDSPQVVVIGLNPAAPADGSSYDLRHQVGNLPDDDKPKKLYYRVRVETESAIADNRKVSAYTKGSVDLIPIVDADTVVHGDKNPSKPMLDADAPPGDNVSDTEDDDALNDDDVVPGQVTLTVTRSAMGSSDDYRVDISDDNGQTWSMVHSSTRPINQTEYEHQGLKPNTPRHFRIFTKKGSDYGVGSNSVRDVSGHSHEPGEVQNLTASTAGSGSINLTWGAPADDGGAMIDKYCIIAVKIDDDKEVIGLDIQRAGIQVSGGDANCTRFSLPDKASITLSANSVSNVAPSTTNVTFKGLDQETRWRFEVYGLNGATAPAVPAPPVETLMGVAEESETEDAKTTEAVVPPAPVNLTAELARDTNFSGVGSRGVLVLWNAPSDPAGAPILGYKVERSIDDGEYEERVSSRDAGMTHWVDTNEPAMDEVRVYRVTSINAVGVGTMMASITIPLAEHTTHTTPPAVDELTAPSITAATPGTGTVMVEWTPGENADGHLAMLFTDDFVGDPVVATKSATDTMHTFPNVANGGYVVVVVSYDNSFDFQFVFTPVSVPAN